MSYNVDELFRFVECGSGYSVAEYLKKDDPTVTELEIPAKYNGKSVNNILESAFSDSEYIKHVVILSCLFDILKKVFYRCKNLESVEFSEGLKMINRFAFSATKLKSVVFPKSLAILQGNAFSDCPELESVTFNSAPVFEDYVFVNCPKLSAEIVLMDLFHSCDISAPFDESDYLDLICCNPNWLRFTRPDVLELAIKNDCFINVDVSVMLRFLVETGNAESLRVAEECGLIKNRELVDKWIESSVQQGTTEFTAYLLDLKRRKFGFDGGGDFEL